MSQYNPHLSQAAVAARLRARLDEASRSRLARRPADRVVKGAPRRLDPRSLFRRHSPQRAR